MAVLWILDGRNWSPWPLAGAVGLSGVAEGPVICDPAGAAAVIVPTASGKPGWLLMCVKDRAVAVNGDAVALGVCVLQDRDTIRLGGNEPVIFSVETLPEIVAYPGTLKPVPCARCGSLISPGERAVQCGRCGAWHHESEGWACWTYAGECKCGQPTALDGNYAWTPEGL